MAHSLSPSPRPPLGGLHGGWASLGVLLTGTARLHPARPAGATGWLRGLIRQLAGPSSNERDLADMPAYLLDDIGLDPLDARPKPLPTDLGDAAMWVGIKTGMYPRL